MNLVDALRRRSLTVAFCESLTAGLAAATLADTPGASDVLRGGLITYATDLKGLLAGVPSHTLRTYGPVSPEVAAGMAEGVREVCLADWGVSLTGVAGPDPQDGHPVGEVWIGYAGEGGVETEKLNLSGTRRDIREAAVDAALRGLLTRVEQTDPAGRCRE
ncbi:CinA family protein [Corynebacterium comes]|uniref:Competence-damage inducible protein n=1 Tax=Corynebacterium comes TaxID=2675218 RepID=A0A6B8W0I9_9CORY|nr:CinA family protein [Corynebacterium comes]QGU04845.1 Putative competence-damage inducible protein [Corynebacterium comes]